MRKKNNMTPETQAAETTTETAPVDTPATAGEDAPLPTNGEEKEFTLQDVDRCYFSPDKIVEANSYVAKVLSTGVEIKRNFDPTKPIPEGYGLAVVPIAKRQVTPGTGSGNVIVGVAVAAVPDPSLIVVHEKGEQFVRDVIMDHFLAKIANSVRPRKDGETAASMPIKVEDFIESRRGKESFKTFTEIAGKFVKGLRKKGLKFMSQPILRQVCQSTAFAKERFEKIDQAVWIAVIGKMITAAKSENLDPAILQNWLDTRDSETLADVEELTIDGLDDLIS